MTNNQNTDAEIFDLLAQEDIRQTDGLTLIPSENHASQQVLAALSSRISDKYAEGYPGKRYYPGNEIADKIETLAIERAKFLFGVPVVNVQPYSGSPANLAIYAAVCEPGAAIMGLDLLDGGHLTHGWKLSMTARFWKSAPYHLNADGTFDFAAIRNLALEHKPKIIICGGTAIPRAIPFAEFAKIADEVDAYLLADISHISGLVAGGQHASPVPHAHLVMTTTHKTLRGPRGAMIMVTQKGLEKDAELGDKINKAIIPGLQGGPHLNNIASIAVALREVSQDSFKDYASRIVTNAKTLADELKSRGFKLITDGTDNHLILIDLTPGGAGRGLFMDLALEKIGLQANRNMVPHDTSTPFYPSGLRLGTPAATTRGMGDDEMRQIAAWMAEVAEMIKDDQLPADKETRLATIKAFKERISKDERLKKMREEVREMCRRFPLAE